MLTKEDKIKKCLEIKKYGVKRLVKEFISKQEMAQGWC